MLQMLDSQEEQFFILSYDLSIIDSHTLSSSGRRFFTSPSITNGYMFIGTWDGSLYRFGDGVSTLDSELIGTVDNVDNNSIASLNWTVESNNEYSWYATANDTFDVTSSDIFTFSTANITITLKLS